MFVPLLAVPLAVTLIAAADRIPKLDVAESCKGAAKPGYLEATDRKQRCIDSEQRTRVQLGKDWTSFPASVRMFCVSSIARFAPTYTELATCLEMRRDLANPKPAEAGTTGLAPSPRR